MDTKITSAAIPPAEELVEVKKPTSLLIAQFFLFPLIIIAICLGIFVLFGYLTYEQRGANQYLDDIRTGSGSTRWLAAVELSNLISSNSKQDPNFVQNVLALYINSKNDDPRVRRFLAISLGKLGDRQAVPALLQGLDDAEELKSAPDTVGPTDLRQVFHNAFNDSATLQLERRDAQVQNQFYTLWALGSIGDNAAVPGILKQLKNEDPAVRKTAAYILGILGDSRALHDLQVALNDVKDNVRWNAAFALARLGDPSGVDLLMTLLDRNQVNAMLEMTPDQRAELMANAVTSLGLLKFEGARDKINALSQNDPDLAVRNAAIEALKKF